MCCGQNGVVTKILQERVANGEKLRVGERTLVTTRNQGGEIIFFIRPNKDFTISDPRSVIYSFSCAPCKTTAR